MEPDPDFRAKAERSHPKVGVALPLANEAGSIENLLKRIVAELDEKDRIFCVLDKASKDGTREIVAGLEKVHPQIQSIWAPENRCVVDAYFCGYRAAVGDGCEWILEMDAGFSHDPAEIAKFLGAMSEGFDYVGGSRYLKGGAHKSPWTRRVISRGGTHLAQIILGSEMTDMTSGFECFNLRAMNHVLSTGVKSQANFFQTEIRTMMHKFSWCEVPITYKNENYGVGRSSIREALQQLWRLRKEKK